MLASTYIDKVVEHLDSVTTQLESIKKIGDFIAQTVLNGKKVYVMDRYNIVDTEIVERPSGLALFRSFREDGKLMGNGDIFILSAFYPGNDDDLVLLEKARLQGAVVISISPEGPLSRAADRAIINNDNGKNGVITIPGIEQTYFCPVSGILNVTLAWALAAEITASLLARSVIPTVHWGEYLTDSAGKNTEARKRFLSLGY